MKISEDLILQCLKELDKQALAKQIFLDYYEGNHAILSDHELLDSSNRTLVFNFPRKFVDTETGYLLGKPVNYVSKVNDTDMLDLIDKEMGLWEKSHNIELRRQSEIFGEAYELNYIDSQGAFRGTVLTPLNGYVLEDGTVEGKAVLALHRFTKPFDEKTYLDVYTDSQILHYKIQQNNQYASTSANVQLVSIGQHQHIFGRVPVTVCPANAQRRCGFHDIISLIDAYNALNTIVAGEISAFRTAYLTIENARIEEEDLLKMKSMGIIQVPKGAEVKWLTKNINDSLVKTQLENLERKIYDIVDQVNFNENWASNTSSLALRNKLLNLENRIAIREGYVERVLKERLKNFFTYIQKKEGKEFDYRDVAVKFTRNLPTDLVGLADVIVKLKDVCSQETLLSLLPFVENPKLELAKFSGLVNDEDSSSKTGAMIYID